MSDSNPYALTTADLRDLRKADCLVYESGDHIDTTSQAQVRCIYRETERESERTVVIPVATTRTKNYEGSGGIARNSHVMMYALHDDVTRGFVTNLRKGDVLNFVWTRGNASPVTREAGIVIDYLDVHIDGVAGSLRDVRRMASSATRDNTARMCR